MKTGRRFLPCWVMAGALCLPLAAPAGAAEHQVVIDGMRFTPQVVRVRPGDTIVWVNRDLFVHNVTAEAIGLRSGELATGKVWRYTVRGKTSVDYVCSFHPTMKGRIALQETK